VDVVGRRPISAVASDATSAGVGQPPYPASHMTARQAGHVGCLPRPRTWVSSSDLAALVVGGVLEELLAVVVSEQECEALQVGPQLLDVVGRPDEPRE